jgi:hypothetical protein
MTVAKYQENKNKKKNHKTEILADQERKKYIERVRDLEGLAVSCTSVWWLERENEVE